MCVISTGGATHLPAREAHAPLAHAVGAAEVELEGVRPRVHGHLGDDRPVPLVVAAHDAGDDDLGIV